MLSSELSTAIAFTTLMILLLIAVVVITIFIANRRNQRQEMTMAQMKVDYERELRAVQYEVQEQVLVNVGRELHDNIGQLLTYMNMQIEQQKYLNPESKPAFEAVSSTLGDTIKEVRRIGKNLNSDLLETQGLLNAMQQEVERLRLLNRYEIDWHYDTEPQITKDQKVIAYRIFQEMLNNTMKHAVTKNMSIKLEGGKVFKMTFSDDGKGFDVGKMKQSATGSGLKNMVKRAELANLVCHIDSAIGKGTTFTLERIG